MSDHYPEAWERQMDLTALRDDVLTEALKFVTALHGTRGSATLPDMAKFDAVVTTYVDALRAPVQCRACGQELPHE